MDLLVTVAVIAIPLALIWIALARNKAAMTLATVALVMGVGALVGWAGLRLRTTTGSSAVVGGARPGHTPA